MVSLTSHRPSSPDVAKFLDRVEHAVLVAGVVDHTETILRIHALASTKLGVVFLWSASPAVEFVIAIIVVPSDRLIRFWRRSERDRQSRVNFRKEIQLHPAK